VAKCSVFLDGRINLNVVKDNSVENVIFCKPFEDSLDNVCLFETRDKEFICKYVYENGDKFVISDVVFEDGSCLKNVKFKLVVVERGDLPHCTLNTSSSQKSSFVPKSKVVLEDYTPDKKYLDEEYNINNSQEIIEIKDNYNEIIKNAKETEKRLLKKEEFLEKERVKLLKEKEILEKNKIIEKEISEQKQSLIKEFLNSVEKQEKLFKDTVDKYTDEIDYKIENKSEKNLNLLKKEILSFTKELQESRSQEIKVQLIEKLNDKEKALKDNLKNIQEEVLKSLVERYSDIKESYDGSFEKFKSKMFHELGAVNKKTLQSFFREGKLILDKNRDSYKSELKKLAESSESALKERKQDIENTFRSVLKEVRDIIDKSNPKLDDKINFILEKAKLIQLNESAKIKKYVDDKVRFSSEDAKNYARRILELGSGGGSVAVQYSKGGIIDGPLNITGTILSAGIDLNSIFSSSTAAGVTQVLSFDSNSNTLSVIPGNYVSLSSINATFNSVSSNYESTYSTVISNSSNWNSSYTTTQLYSAGWQAASSGSVSKLIAGTNISISPSGGTGIVTINATGSMPANLGELPTLSSDWNNTYSTVISNSANWNQAYNQISTTSSQISFLSAEIQKNEYQNIFSNYETLEEFVVNPHPNLYLGYTVTLSSNNRVYILAGNNQNNSNHYIELNPNPERPIYKEQTLNNTGLIIDSFDLADFTSAKYLLQVNTNYNNEVYYSEINVLGVGSTGESVATEYGQLYTSPLISEYSSYISSGKLFLSATFISYTSDPTKKYIIRGLRSNFYKI